MIKPNPQYPNSTCFDCFLKIYTLCANNECPYGKNGSPKYIKIDPKYKICFKCNQDKYKEK